MNWPSRIEADASSSEGALIWYTAHATINRNQVNVQRFNVDADGSFIAHLYHPGTGGPAHGTKGHPLRFHGS